MQWNTKLHEASRDADRTVFRVGAGAVIAIDHPPHASTVGRPPEFIDALLREVGEFVEAKRILDTDDTLSDVGRERSLAPRRKALEDQLATTTGNAQGFAIWVEDMERLVLAPPQLDKTDVVGAFRDMEVRNRLSGLGGKARGEAMELVAKTPHMIEAVMRSPMPIPGFSELAAKVWPEHVLKTHPEAPRIVAHQEARDWANSSLAGITAAAEQVLKASQPPAARQNQAA